MTLISARRLLGRDGWITGGFLEIIGGSIVGVGANATNPKYAYLIPGYIDLQINGFSDIDLATAPPHDWPKVGTALAGHGVTSWVPTLISRPLPCYPRWLAAVGELQSRWTPGTPRILGVHLEGPWLGKRKGAHVDTAGGAIDLRWIAELPDLVKIVTLAPERSGAMEAIEALRNRDIVTALGHTDADHPTATEAFNRGATLLTHCFNANPPLHHRSPGVVGAALARDEVFVSIIADGQHIHPDVIRITMRAKGPDKVALISDASGWASGSLGTRPTRLVEGAPRLADGSLAGSAIALDQAVRYVVEHCGVSTADAVRSASTVPANLLKRPDLGRIAAGATADIVALDDELQVCGVWVAGERVC